jgi:hypothetical protein
VKPAQALVLIAFGCVALFGAYKAGRRANCPSTRYGVGMTR